MLGDVDHPFHLILHTSGGPCLLLSTNFAQLQSDLCHNHHGHLATTHKHAHSPHFDFRHTRDIHKDMLTHDVRSHRVKRAKFFLPLKTPGLGTKKPLLVGPIIIPIIPALLAPIFAG